LEEPSDRLEAEAGAAIPWKNNHGSGFKTLKTRTEGNGASCRPGNKTLTALRPFLDAAPVPSGVHGVSSRSARTEPGQPHFYE